VVIVERQKRKGPILTPSSLPCLGNMPTINITEGCAHGCLYCYTQGYSGYPGAGRVVLFDNIPELVRTELCRKRRRPRRVYFSPSSDAFQPVPEILDVTYQTMSVLLESGVEVAFLTKGAIEERFLAMFSRCPTSVSAQIGITTLDQGLWRAFESGAASPRQRLQTIEDLTRIGVATRARLDPLMPDLTDTEENLSALLAELSRRGVQDIAASYLFLRPAFARGLSEHLHRGAGSARPACEWHWHDFADGVGGGQMIDREDRRQRFDRLEVLAAKHGIGVHVCACKNPDLAAGSNCRIAGPSPAALPMPDAPLFRATEP
jgi:DNA repair photolyase